MKLIQSFRREVDRFLGRHPNFGIPNLMRYIVIGNAVLFLLSMMDRSGRLMNYLYFVPSLVLRGQIWRLVSFVFVPEAGSLITLVLLLYFEYFIGSTLERAWGSARFTAYYVCGMLLTVLYGFIALLFGVNIRAGASYLGLSMFFVFATLWPDTQVLLFFIIPIKMKWLAIVEAVFFIVNMVSARSLLPLVGILNYFLFCGDSLPELLAPLLRRVRPQAVRHRQTVRQNNRDSRTLPYTYKCAVCGRTDAEYPQLEFRYCSRCVGYHCFCSDHIGSHVHFTK